MLVTLNISFFLVLLGVLSQSAGYIVEPGPLVKATKGAVWPKPQIQSTSKQFYIVRPDTFQFRVVGESCNILTNALQRYVDIIKGSTISPPTSENLVQKKHNQKPWSGDDNFAGYLDSLEILLTDFCQDDEIPTYEMKEQYILNITEKDPVLSAASIWGMLRGLETFSQLLHPAGEEALQVSFTNIFDYPRFPHRGLMIDTSRHYIPVTKIYKSLDAMSYNKFNVFHWHITDDQSFPYQSIKYPELSKKGAYASHYIYSPEVVQKIIKYAAERGIRVIVEFDAPGHTRSWGEALPDVLTACYTNGAPSGQYGPMDPTKDTTFSFLKEFFAEIVTVFPDQYLHLGADEVGYECWQSNPDINKYMRDHNTTDYRTLEDIFIKELSKIALDLKAKPVVWEEAFANKLQIPKETVVHVWRDWMDWRQTTSQATKAGFPVLLSACWYLDHLATGGDWQKFYDCEPMSFPGDEEQKKLLLGGEACMWAEVVNEYNIESRVWPRASAVAEKLWSAENADSKSDAAKRLEEHTCRMNKRGIEAQPPNASGFCL